MWKWEYVGELLLSKDGNPIWNPYITRPLQVSLPLQLATRGVNWSCSHIYPVSSSTPRNISGLQSRYEMLIPIRRIHSSTAGTLYGPLLNEAFLETLREASSYENRGSGNCSLKLYNCNPAVGWLDTLRPHWTLFSQLGGLEDSSYTFLSFYRLLTTMSKCLERLQLQAMKWTWQWSCFGRPWPHPSWGYRFHTRHDFHKRSKIRRILTTCGKSSQQLALCHCLFSRSKSDTLLDPLLFQDAFQHAPTPYSLPDSSFWPCDPWAWRRGIRWGK